MVDSVPKAVLSEMLHQSILAENGMTMTDYLQHTNILRIRVLDGEDIPANEMLYICNQIRQGRRTAEPRLTASVPRKKAPARPELLTDLLDQDL